MTSIPIQDKDFPDPHQDLYDKNVLGFWIYLMTDCLIFASLFATYAILHKATFGGPSSHEIYDLKTALIETIFLLCSSFTCGLGILSAQRSKKAWAFFWLAIAFLFGASFVATELHEFISLVNKGHTWRVSAFLSSYFTLVGTHGFHVSVGLFWLLIMFFQLGFMGITKTTFRRLVCFSMFWHFLDLVWVFIFTFVYLMGVI
jgi:cytochrome o ubiquinol oxidase subunit III